MATEQSNVPKIVPLDNLLIDKDDLDEIQRMLVEFEYSILQLVVDGRKEKELLKIIAIDKILKLHFPENYVAFFSKNKEILTETEKKIFDEWIKNGNYEINDDEFLIKNSFKENTKYIYELTLLSNKYYLLLYKDKTISLIYNFIKKALLTKVLDNE